MGPLHSFLHETLQEGCCLARSGFSFTRTVGQITMGRRYQLGVIFHAGHMPRVLMNFFSDRFDGSSQPLTIGEEPGKGGAESSDDGSSEGGQFDEGAGLEVLLRPVHAICEHQSTLSVSVSNLHSQSLPASDDIRRAVSVFINGVLDQSDAAGKIDTQLLLDYSLEGREDGHGTAFVQEHVQHATSCIREELPDLISSPPVSKQTPFPTYATHSLLVLSPWQLRLTKTGLLTLARPTACISLNPSFTKSSPLITVIPTPECSFAKFQAIARKY